MGRERSMALAIKWLLKSIDKNTGGSRANYSLFWNGLKGWSGPYPETTGYIIPTFLELSKISKCNQLKDKAEKMGNWLLTLQFKDGSFPGGIYSGKQREKSVFNTGQIILGLTELFTTTGRKEFLKSSQLAADWLVGELDDSGNWLKHNYVNNFSPSYYTRVVWPILKVAYLTGDPDLKTGAIKAIESILTHRKKNSFISGSGFKENGPTVLHTLAYTIRGLLESAELLGNQEYYSYAENISYKILRKFELNKRFWGAYYKDFQGVKWYQCLTGNVQMVIIWLKIYLKKEDPRFLNAAVKAIDSVAEKQIKSHWNKNLVGAIPGSSPVFGRYMMFRYPNWAVKFFLDAILLERKALGKADEIAKNAVSNTVGV